MVDLNHDWTLEVLIEVMRKARHALNDSEDISEVKAALSVFRIARRTYYETLALIEEQTMENEDVKEVYRKTQAK